MNKRAAFLAVLAASFPAEAGAQEVFAGVSVHEVDTPFTLRVGEGGADLVAGYRFAPIAALAVVGKPAPYVIASLNTGGDTSFVGAGLGWTIGKGRLYARPAIGIVVHDGPDLRVDPVTRNRTDLGSRILFAPEIALGYRATERVSVEAAWVHISQGRIFNGQQNPGIDMIGARLNYGL
jgi:hypothetical protein